MGQSPDSVRGAIHAHDEDVLLVLPVRNVVLMPGGAAPLSVGRARSIAAVQEAMRGERPIGLLLQRDAGQDEPDPAGMHGIGTVASVIQHVVGADGVHQLVCRGEHRFRVLDFMEGQGFMLARVEHLRDAETVDVETEARALHLRHTALEALKLLAHVPAELVRAIEEAPATGALADLIAGYMDLKPDEKQQLLALTDVRPRIERVSEIVTRRVEVLRLTQEISQQTKDQIDERQREFLLREQLRTIQKELGEVDDATGDLEDLARAVTEAKMPPEAEAHARKELKRLKRMPEQSAEYGMARTWLESFAELPWSRESEDRLDIAEARRVLDEDHHGLDKVKRRILEHLAVRKLSPQGKSPILCFVGPPGVGKTSLGQSIARAMGRQFQRVSLGGVHDEAEIRGHRRTYIGALPGNIIQALRKAGTRNPVLMLDELDKLGNGFHGDPSAALLEVLDPEQNGTFRDNYLGVAFDLSRVLFVGTANVLDQVPGPLRDRMEVIELPGYTEDEKLEIARRYLLPRQREASGLTAEQGVVGDDTLRTIIRDYTREAGVRNLEREIGAVLRNGAVRVAEGEATLAPIVPASLATILGARKFESELALRTAMPGVATGLAWTPVGGDILFVEASRFPGAGKLILTGHLGEVMKESAQAALSLLKLHAGIFGLQDDAFEKHDIHVHVPAGAIPKDGPSAGVAMYVALASLMTGRCVRADTAMTGEISLRGLVLPVGGIKEKVVAAHRAGLKRVVLPARNRKDYEDIPAGARSQLEFVWVEDVEEAMAYALTDEAPRQRSLAS